MEDNHVWSLVQHVSTQPFSEEIVYLNNLAMSQGHHLDPMRNTKYPGQMVVSVMRKHLPAIQGVPLEHKPYDLDDLVVWLQPKKVKIPTMLEYTRNRHPHTKLLDKGDRVIRSALLDFGPSSHNRFELAY